MKIQYNIYVCPAHENIMIKWCSLIPFISFFTLRKNRQFSRNLWVTVILSDKDVTFRNPKSILSLHSTFRQAYEISQSWGFISILFSIWRFNQNLAGGPLAGGPLAGGVESPEVESPSPPSSHVSPLNPVSQLHCPVLSHVMSSSTVFARLQQQSAIWIHFTSEL